MVNYKISYYELSQICTLYYFIFIFIFNSLIIIFENSILFRYKSNYEFTAYLNKIISDYEDAKDRLYQVNQISDEDYIKINNIIYYLFIFIILIFIIYLFLYII